MSADEHKQDAPAMASMRVSVVTVSDTRTSSTDVGGNLVADLCRQAGIVAVQGPVIVHDDPIQVHAEVKTQVASRRVHAVLLTGGTGIARRDSTVEALAGAFDKTLEGFGELFRMLSFQDIGPAAMLSRATAGVIDGVLVFLMPGSLKAVELAMSRLILPELAHMVGQLGGLSVTITAAPAATSPERHHDPRPHRQHGPR